MANEIHLSATLTDKSTRSALLDSYVHKTVEHRRKNAQLNLLTALSLFSSNAIDVGTNLLLRVIAEHAPGTFGKGLDLGCGYGALGIALSASGAVKNIEMVDRDALAVEFSKLNSTGNGLSNAESHSSLWCDDVLLDGYDLVVSNLPGKVGPDILRHFLNSAALHLEPEGQFWGVVVNPLWTEIQTLLEALEVTVLHVETGPRHTVFGFSRSNIKTEPDQQASSVEMTYKRDEVDFSVARRTYRMDTSRGVRDFEGPGYTTRLLLEQLYELRKERWGEAAVFNVSQGYLPVATIAAGMTGSVHLVDRDLLALRTAEWNLQVNRLGASIGGVHHTVGWLPETPAHANGFDFVAGVLRGDEPRQAIEVSAVSLADRLNPGGIAVVSGGSTPITRMVKLIGARKDVRILDRNRYRGSSVITLQKS